MPLANLLPCKNGRQRPINQDTGKTYIARHKNRPKKYSIHEAIILKVDMVYNEETWM